MLRLENVGLKYGDGPEILRDVSFAVHPGDFYFLTGPSGAGKSSLLKLLFCVRRVEHCAFSVKMLAVSATAGCR